MSPMKRNETGLVNLQHHSCYKTIASVWSTVIVIGLAAPETVADPGDGDASPPASHNAPKLAILRSKMEKKFWWGGTAHPTPISLL